MRPSHQFAPRRAAMHGCLLEKNTLLMLRRSVPAHASIHGPSTDLICHSAVADALHYVIALARANCSTEAIC
eukprot:2178176-Pyramimonas_sp.AAC.1